jgi:hypothetical protein
LFSIRLLQDAPRAPDPWGRQRLRRALGAFAQKIFANEWVIDLDHLGDGRGGQHLVVGQHGHAVGQRHQRVQVVRDHDHGQAELAAQFADQRP